MGRLLRRFLGYREKYIKQHLKSIILKALKSLRCISPYSEGITEELILHYYETSSIGSEESLAMQIEALYYENLAKVFFPPIAYVMTASEVEDMIISDIEDWFASIPKMENVCKAVFNDVNIDTYG
mgnify:CR=1 FL=1